MEKSITTIELAKILNMSKRGLRTFFCSYLLQPYVISETRPIFKGIQYRYLLNKESIEAMRVFLSRRDKFKKGWVENFNAFIEAQELS